MNKVIITLTTVPERLDSNPTGLKKCINSLLSQDYDDFEIHFNIPEIYKLTGEKYIIPEWLEENTKLKIFRTTDFGPITKILPTIFRVSDPKTIIIVVDDDLEYHSGMVSEHLRLQKSQDGVFGYDGRARYDGSIFPDEDIRNYFVVSVFEDTRVKIIQHYKSVSYKRHYFTENLLEFLYKTQSDDITLSTYMNFKNIPLIVANYPDEEQLYDYKDWKRKGGVTTFPILSHTDTDIKNTGCQHPLAPEDKFFIPEEFKKYLT
tara:strand:+ start:22 stop:807 length:786 start_codon:yes stop_codon:yes gene_type:complete